MADPREEFRWKNIKIIDPDLTESQEENLVFVMDNLKLGPKYSCSYCGAGYTQEGYLKRHLETKHEVEEKKKPEHQPECDDCGKLFANAKTLEKHMKTHLKCKTCKQEFQTMQEAKHHKKEHTFCNICQKDFHFVSKLTKHCASNHKPE